MFDIAYLKKINFRIYIFTGLIPYTLLHFCNSSLTRSVSQMQNFSYDNVDLLQKRHELVLQTFVRNAT